jgi:arylsulfatase A-like enzyme
LHGSNGHKVHFALIPSIAKLAGVLKHCLVLLLFGIFVATLHAERPNVILVMADDQGWGDTGYNGHPVVKTPNLDAMAADGLVFNRFHAAAPVCSPTRGSVLTGRHPFRIKITNHGRYMRPQETTIAEALRDAGYVTGMFGKWHVGSAQPGSPVNPGGSGFDEWVIGLNFFDNDQFLSRNGIVEQIEGSGSEITIDETIAFLRKHRGAGKPMFAIAWFPSPHDPHLEKPPGPDPYEGLDGAGYFREIAVLDHAFGRLRAELKALDIEQNTILWYCSDNGGLREESSGGRARKGSIYEGGLRVPGILEWPAKIQPGKVDVPATTSDIMPTVLSMVGVTAKDHYPWDGIDLTPIIKGDSTRRPAIGFWHGLQGGQSTWSDRILKAVMQAQQAGDPTPHPERLRKDIDEYPQFPEDKFIGHAAWLDWPWKLHRKEKDDVSFELYNLVEDPLEATDLAQDPKHTARLQQMQNELAEWQLSVTRSLNGKDYGSATAGN